MLNDLAGKRFGKLTVIERVEKPKSIKNRNAYWRCICDCGVERIVQGQSLTHGTTKSCGCQRRTTARNKVASLVGKTFGTFRVIGEVPDQGPHTRRKWICVCQCGEVREYLTGELNRIEKLGGSCGCVARKNQSLRMRAQKTTHGCTGTKLYNVWLSVRRRCFSETCKEYRFYGARGISMCDEWKNDFLVFKDWAMASGYDPDAKRGDCTLERINVNGDYSPDNCCWIPASEQGKNKRKTIKLTCNGETHTLKEWSEISGVPTNTIRDRLSYGWPIEDVIFKERRIWDCYKESSAQTEPNG